MSSVNSRVPPLRLMAVDTPSDGQIPSYQSSSGQFEWVDDSSGGTPGGSNNEIQFNNSGAFGGDAGFIMSNKADGAGTSVLIGEIVFGGSVYAAKANTANGSILISPEGTGLVRLASNDDAGGTKTDLKLVISSNANTDESILVFENQTGTVHTGEIKMDSSSNFTFENQVDTKNIQFTTKGTGGVDFKNSTSNTNSTVYIRGNGTGTPILNLLNDTKSITLRCNDNQKLTVEGGANTFVFDASSGTGGITFPDGTTQTTAASGGGNQLLPNGEAGYGTAARFNLHKCMPFNNAPDAYTNFNFGSGSARAAYYPFLAGHDGTIDEIGIDVAASASGKNLLVGIYSTGSNGLPDTLLGSATISIASTGKVYQTSITGTITLVKGTQYYVAWVVDSGSGLFSSSWYWSEDTGTQYSINVDYENSRNLDRGCTIVQSSGSTYALDSDVSSATFYPGEYSNVGIPCISVSFA